MFPQIPDGCYCRPALETLRRMPLQEQRAVPRLTIGKEQFGEVCFEVMRAYNIYNM